MLRISRLLRSFRLFSTEQPQSGEAEETIAKIIMNSQALADEKAKKKDAKNAISGKLFIPTRTENGLKLSFQLLPHSLTLSNTEAQKLDKLKSNISFFSSLVLYCDGACQQVFYIVLTYE